MATPLSADRMLAALEQEGCTVVEYKGWRTHSRNHVGAWGPVHGVVIHHTVSSGTDNSVALCYNGHSSLPGPLCHTVGAKDGRLFMVGHGRANHAGKGDPDVLRAVIDEIALPADNEATVDGNARFYGIELINLGDGRDPWPAVQVDAAARWAAALCRAHGWSEKSVIGHKEWQPGKIDPTFDMNAFRARVKRFLTQPPGHTPDDVSQESSDVPHYLSLGMKTEFPLAPDEWAPVAWNTEYSDPLKQHAANAATFATACQYNGVAYLRLRGVTPGADVQARLVEEDSAGRVVVEHPVVEGQGSGAGSTFLAVPVVGRVAAGRRVRVQLAQFGEGPATVEPCYLKAQVWKS